MVTRWVSSGSLDRCKGTRAERSRHGRASPLRDELPRIALVVDLGGAGTGGSGAGGAVVLTFQGDAVALLLGGGRGGSRVGEEGKSRGERTGQGETVSPSTAP